MSMFIENSICSLKDMLLDGRICLDDLMRECISRVHRYKKYKAWAYFDEDILSKDYEKLEKAGEYYAEGKAYGIPFGVKDVINTLDYPTQMGSVIWSGFESGNDARIVYDIKHNGGIVAGKTVTAEFAVHTLNETLNPYDVDRTPGTSSSGSAVAVALGMVPVALATQTAGSIIRPASFCGVFGYVPSFGLIPRTGVLKTTDSLDTIGFMTSNIKNLEPVLNILSVKGPNYPFVYSASKDPARAKLSDRKWRIAFIKTYTWEDADDFVRYSIEEFCKRLSCLQEIEFEELNIDNTIYGAHGIHATIYNKCLSYYFENEHHDREHVSETMNQLIEDGEKIKPDDFFDALNKQSEMVSSMDSLMSEYDAIISMSTASVAPYRGVTEKMDPSLIWTLLHLPSINIPVFIDENSGMPYGIQISARRFNDKLLIDFIKYLDEAGMIHGTIREPKVEW